MSNRLEFTPGIIAKRFAHCNGRCEWPTCGMILRGRADYEADHDKTAEEGGDNSFENCRILCLAHHAEKTNKHDKPRIAKGTRQMKARAGVKPKGRGFPTNRDGKWRKPLNCPAVLRDEE